MMCDEDGGSLVGGKGVRAERGPDARIAGEKTEREKGKERNSKRITKEQKKNRRKSRQERETIYRKVRTDATGRRGTTG